jgi:hypothetical protein
MERTQQTVPKGFQKWQKVRAMAVQAYSGPEVCRRLRLPDFKKIGI